jgi:hypothetical protein
LETKVTGSGPVESNRGRGQGSLWTVAPTEETKKKKTIAHGALRKVVVRLASGSHTENSPRFQKLLLKNGEKDSNFMLEYILLLMKYVVSLSRWGGGERKHILRNSKKKVFILNRMAEKKNWYSNF